MHRQNGMWEFGIIIFFDFLYTIYSPILCFIYVCTVCLHQLFCHFHHIYHTYTFQEHYKIKNNPTRFSIFYFVFNIIRHLITSLLILPYIIKHVRSLMSSNLLRPVFFRFIVIISKWNRSCVLASSASFVFEF